MAAMQVSAMLKLLILITLPLDGSAIVKRAATGRGAAGIVDESGISILRFAE